MKNHHLTLIGNSVACRENLGAMTQSLPRPPSLKMPISIIYKTLYSYPFLHNLVVGRETSAGFSD